MADATDGGKQETPAKRGEAAWRAARDEVSRRNDEAHKRGRAEQKARKDATADRTRADATREADQLRGLNARIEKERGTRRPGA